MGSFLLFAPFNKLLFYLLITRAFPALKHSLLVFSLLPQTPVTHGHLMPSSAEPAGSYTTCRAHQSVQDARTDGLKKYLISAQLFPAEVKSVLCSNVTPSAPETRSQSALTDGKAKLLFPFPSSCGKERVPVGDPLSELCSPLPHQRRTKCLQQTGRHRAQL